jgi:hypothetical protein
MSVFLALAEGSMMTFAARVSRERQFLGCRRRMLARWNRTHRVERGSETASGEADGSEQQAPASC